MIERFAPHEQGKPVNSSLYKRLRPRADIAIDLGTANTLVYVAGRGIVFNEPSLCSFIRTGSRPRLLAAGQAARAMLGRTPENITVAKPMRHGVVMDIETGREMIGYAVRRATKTYGLRRPRVAIGVPSDATAAEREAFKAVARDAGATASVLVEEPLAAAIGAGLPVGEPIGSMIVDCGSSTTEVAVIVLGAIRVARTVRMGGETLDQALIDHLHRRRRFLIGPATAEQLKLQIARYEDAADQDLGLVHLKGRDLTSACPSRAAVPAAELVSVLAQSIRPIIAAVRSALASTPPDLCDDIYDNGIVLTGGNAMTAVVARGISDDTGLPVSIAPAPLESVALGLGRMIG